MRKIVTLIAFVLLLTNWAKGQYVTLQDDNFRNYLRNLYPTCFNAAGQMDTTCSTIVNASSLMVDNYTANIRNLDGLRYFKNTLSLAIYDHHFDVTVTNIDTIPALPPLLKYFECWASNISTLPALPASLETIICMYSNRLTYLPALPNGFKSLKLINCNQLNSIPSLINTSIEYLEFPYNDGSGFVSPITSLPNFPNSLRFLSCSGHRILGSLPPLAATSLDTLIFFNCLITTLPNVPQSLKYLSCSGNPFSQFPPLPNGLQHLECIIMNWQDTSAPVLLPSPLPTGLKYLNCAANRLSSLPPLPTSIETVIAYENMLTSLPLWPNSLKELNIDDNPTLRTISNFPASLLTIRCANNGLSTLPNLPPFLQTLYCNHNNLTSLPSLPNSLQTLSCHTNRLSYLPDLPAALQRLYCFDNNIYCLPKLPAGREILELQIDSKIMCLPNYRNHIINGIWGPPNGIPYNNGQYPLCNPTNNSNNCQSFPIMQGVIYYDNNNNGIKDANEPVKKNGQVLLSNGIFGFTNNSGFYEIGADSIGAYSLSATAPRHFNIQPAAVSYNFNTYDTLATKNFALQANTSVEEVAVKITPINWAARPGFSFPYLISYENTGTTTLSPNIIFDYDQSRLNYNTSSEAGVVDNADNLAFNTGTLMPGESNSFIGYFTLKTTVPLGDTLNAKAIISANAFTAYDSIQTIVRGAFDPNDKQATPQLSPSQVANGKYIDYTIRFQNTGTDTAFNIVISDTLNDNLQAGTLEMLVSSHNCKTTVKDNIVFFEFLNILLPDSNVNEKASHGFVSFRIKPQTTVLPNTTIPNKAAIYFDYNAPVITNIAGTLIKDFTTIPLKLISFSAVPKNDNTISLYWNTANEINTKQFVIERGNDGLRFSSITSVTAKGKATNDYYASVADANAGITFYRLKIVDNDGTFSYSPIIKIDKRKNAAGFSILTNPAKDFIIINTTDRSLNNTPTSIINMQGAVVKSFFIKEGSQPIEIKGLPNGIYYLRTVNGNSKFLKQ